MTGPGNPWTAAAFRQHERHLWGVAYRMRSLPSSTSGNREVHVVLASAKLAAVAPVAAVANLGG